MNAKLPTSLYIIKVTSLLHACRPGHYLKLALKDESSFLGVPLSGKYDAVQLKADMKCLVDGLAAQLEVRLGENGCDDVTSAMHFLSLHSWPQRAADASMFALFLSKECAVMHSIY